MQWVVYSSSPREGAGIAGDCAWSGSAACSSTASRAERRPVSSARCSPAAREFVRAGDRDREFPVLARRSRNLREQFPPVFRGGRRSPVPRTRRRPPFPAPWDARDSAPARASTSSRGWPARLPPCAMRERIGIFAPDGRVAGDLGACGDRLCVIRRGLGIAVRLRTRGGQAAPRRDRRGDCAPIGRRGRRASKACAARRRRPRRILPGRSPRPDTRCIA